MVLITPCIPTSGVEVNTHPVTPQETAKNIDTLSTQPEINEFDNAVLLKYEARSRENLDRRQLSPGEKEKIIIRSYVTTMLALAFERIYRTIWGSQLTLIQDLNIVGYLGIYEAEISSRYFEPAKLRYPEVYEHYSFDRWLDFLTGFDLALKTEENVVITIEGKEFLKYIIDQGLTSSKTG